jgi:hypothetical protein
MVQFLRIRSLGGIALVLAMAVGCGSAADGNEDAPVVDSPSPVTDTRVLTPEEVKAVHERNARELAARGTVYTLQVGHDHEIVFLETEDGSGMLERIGPNAVGPATGADDLSKHRTPADIFRHYRPNEAIPTVLVDLTARWYPSPEQLADAATYTETPPAGEGLERDVAGDPGFASPAGPGMTPNHATSSGAHFRDDNHSFGDGATDTGCVHTVGETIHRCWLNRSSGGFTEFKSTHLVAHFALFQGTNTPLSLTVNGTKRWETTVLTGEIWRVTWNGPWECPGIFCQFPGYTAVTMKVSWNGSNRGWHYGASYADRFRN